MIVKARASCSSTPRNMIKVSRCLMMFLGSSTACVRGDRLWRRGLIRAEIRHRHAGASRGSWSSPTGGIGLTVTSIIIGFLIGGILIDKNISHGYCCSTCPLSKRGEICRLKLRSARSSVISLRAGRCDQSDPGIPARDMRAAFSTHGNCWWDCTVARSLWRDKLGQISSVAVTPRCSGAPARRCNSSC